MKSLVGPFKSMKEMHQVVEIFNLLGIEVESKNYSLDPLRPKQLLAPKGLDLEMTVLAPNIDPEAFIAQYGIVVAPDPRTPPLEEPTAPQLNLAKPRGNRAVSEPLYMKQKKKKEVK